MKQAYLSLVKFALDRNCIISVYDGEEWAVKRSKSYTEIVDSIKSVEEAEIVIYNEDNVKQAWALVSPYGLQPDETVINNTVCEFMRQFDNIYYIDSED